MMAGRRMYEMNRLRSDLRFFRYYHIFAHLLFLIVLIRYCLDTVMKYQNKDEEIRTIIYNVDDPVNCDNISWILEDYISKKNQAAKEIIFAFAYTMTIFVTLMLMVGQVWLIITLDVCFKWTILALNIFIPFLHPYLSVAIFIASSCLSFVCICFKLRLKFGQRNYQKHQRESVRLDISSPIQPVHQQTINDTIPANENTNANNSNNIYHPLLHLMPSSQHHSLQRLQPLLRPETEQFLEQNLEERTEF